ncbi:protein GVQW3-like [Lycorma delicatula]|uniref:protein GVQW3-like n=1 Tax=Lycorma delicatula TaxID=130591 RepID=UPI003F50E177
MACPLEVFTLVEQRSVIHYLLSEGKKPAKIISRMILQYGESCMNRGNLYKWVEQFKNGRISVTDEQRPGQPVEVSTLLFETRIDDIIREDRRITVEYIAKTVAKNVGTIHNVISNKLKCSKRSARWVPKGLTQ